MVVLSDEGDWHGLLGLGRAEAVDVVVPANMKINSDDGDADCGCFEKWSMSFCSCRAVHIGNLCLNAVECRYAVFVFFVFNICFTFYFFYIPTR